MPISIFDCPGLMLDELGRVILADEDLDRVESFGNLSAGGINTACTGSTNNGTCTNSVCSNSSNGACTNQLVCGGSSNVRGCAVPREVEE
jgi:hypothetical protein